MAFGNAPKTSSVPFRLPRWLEISGIAIVLGTAVLTARIIWEETVWTWQRGPQMIGFSLAHGPGAILLFFPPLLMIWALLAIVLTVKSKFKKRRTSGVTWALLATAVVLFGMGELPDGSWQIVFASRMASSPRAGDLLFYAACEGNLITVRALVSRGVPIDSIDHADWRTALHGAAVNGNARMVQYLLLRGANIDAVDRSGDSPLELAYERHNEQAVAILTEHGAKRIRGDDKQRAKAIEDRVNESIEELDRDEAADPKLPKDIRKAKQEEQSQQPAK